MQHDHKQPDSKHEKRVVLLPADLAARIDEAAAKGGIPVDSWLAETVALRFLSETLRRALAQWELTAGPLTERQIADGLMRAWSVLGMVMP